ncbi:MAG: hypothetical protein F7C33_05055 [Desulfurococcales archaeon]|nr:hypothetical protein [Desulfurococcales archaeon]
MRGIAVLLVILALAFSPCIATAQPEPSPSPPIPQPVHYERLIVPIPAPASRAGATIIVGGPPGFTLYNDVDFNGAPSEGERIGQASLHGALDLVRLEVTGGNDTLVPLVSTSKVWGMVYARVPGHGALSYSIPLPGTKLLAPPLEGVLLIAPDGNRTARVLVGGSLFTVRPGEILKVIKPRGATLVVANTSIVGVLYNASGRDAWATELVPANMSYTPVITLSSATASLVGGNCSVAAMVVGINGNYTVYEASKIFTAVAIPGVKGVVYYMVEGCGGVGVAPLYPSIVSEWPRPGMVPLSSHGVGGGHYIAALSSGVPSSILLADTDGDGDFDMIVTREPGDAPVVDGGGISNGVIVSRGEAPILIERSGDGILLYSIIYPSASLTPPSGILGEITGEGLNLISQVKGGTLRLTVDVTPRTGLGGVTRAVAALLGPDLKPLPGTFRELKPSNSSKGVLEASIEVPASQVRSGYYLVYLVLYQKGIGYGVTFRGPPPLQVLEEEKWVSKPYKVVGGPLEPSAYSVRFSLAGHWDAPTLRDVDFKTLATLLASARAPSTPVQTGISVERILVNGTTQNPPSGIPLALLVVVLAGLVVAGIAIVRLYRGG